MKRIRFVPQNNNWWWTVRAQDDRFIIATQQAPFHPKGTPQYTVVDLTGWTFTYNGVPPGVVRSSLNILGGGYDCETEGWEHQMLAELNDGTWELSRRRVMSVKRIETE